MNGTLIATAIALAISLSPAAGQDKVLAKIGDQTITASQFDRILKLYDAERSREMKRNPGFRMVVLERYVEETVLAAKARKDGLDALPEVVERIKLATNQVLAQACYQREIANLAPSEDQLLQYYESHKPEFTKPQQASVSQIFIRADRSASAEVRGKAKLRAEGIRKKLAQGEDFAALAAQESDDPAARAKGGSLGFVSRGRMVPAIDRILFSLNPGQISGVVESAGGYSVFKVDELREAQVKPFETVKDLVKSRVLLEMKRRATQEFRARAIKEANVEYLDDGARR